MGAGEGRGVALVLGVGGLEGLLAAVARLPQPARPFQVVAGLGQGRGCLVDAGLGLGDHRILQRQLLLDRGQRRLLRRQLRLRLRQLGAVVAVVDPDKRVARLDHLVVGDQHRRHRALDLRAERRGVALHIGVVGGLEEPVDGPPPVAEIAGGGDGGQGRNDDDGLAHGGQPGG
jgi:hypothetical protein